MHLDIFALEIASTAASQIPHTLLCTVLLSQLKGINSPEIVLCIKALFSLIQHILFHSL